MTIIIPLLLSSIAAVESGGNAHAVGKAGELSAYQISPAVWKQHAKPDEPHALASTNAELAAHIAEKHIIALMRQLEAAGVPVTVETLADAWHSGAHGAINRRLKTATPTDYSARVRNLYDEAVAKQPSNVPEHLK